MGDGNPVTHTGGTNLFPFEKDRVEIHTIQIMVIVYNDLCHFFERRFLAYGLHIEKNALLIEL